MSSSFPIEVRGLTMAYGSLVIQQHLNFKVRRGEIFVIMGGSGCGKSTLLRHLVGLQRPAAGKIFREGRDFWDLSSGEREQLQRGSGILYQTGALWSSMTLAENIALPLQQFTSLRRREIKDLCSFKLALVGLAGCEGLYPSEISGGMRKRAALARALALDPQMLFLDEPSAGLDPATARRLDDLILELRENLSATIVVISHELASIFAIGTDAIFLDGDSKTIIAHGHPKEMLEQSTHPLVRQFLTRGEATH